NEAEKGKRQRGASTISQQTAKNVFLWSGHSYIRKGLEVYYTFLIEHIWGKERIMEVYLNSIEMGKNIYGAEAVAQVNFRKSAKALTAGESALIAATLPNPIRFNSAKPSAYIQRRQAKILDLMWKVKPVEFDKEETKEVKKSVKKKKK
ncbi:transglycosylase domain-containing protein, partial [Dysgonomonas sp. UBA7698]